MTPTTEIKFSFNRIYREVFTTQARYIDIQGGRGRGGSHFATEYALFLITQPRYFRGYFVRQVFGDIRDSLFRDFKDRIENNDDVQMEEFAINENEMKIIHKPTGNMIISKGIKAEGGRTAKMKSLAGATHIFMEEADEAGEDDFDQMDDSLRTTRAQIQIIRVFNPPHKDHWWWKRHYTLVPAPRPADIAEKDWTYFTAVPRTDTNLLSIFSTYYDNVININESTRQKWEGYRITKPEYYWTVIRGLISEGMRGRIFSNVTSITNDYFNSLDYRSIFALDFGKHTAITEIKTFRNQLYMRQLNYDELTDKHIAIKFMSLQIPPSSIVIADSAKPLSINKLRQGWKVTELSPEEAEKYPNGIPGLNIYGVKKLPGSVYTGIQDLQDCEMFLTEDSVDWWNEYREYKWALDKDKNPTDEPVDDHNHCWDCARYTRWGKGRLY